VLCEFTTIIFSVRKKTARSAGPIQSQPPKEKRARRYGNRCKVVLVHSTQLLSVDSNFMRLFPLLPFLTSFYRAQRQPSLAVHHHTTTRALRHIYRGHATTAGTHVLSGATLSRAGPTTLPVLTLLELVAAAGLGHHIHIYTRSAFYYAVFEYLSEIYRLMLRLLYNTLNQQTNIVTLLKTLRFV
jgi:hypothetical protein